ncbi:DUF305 domain-containing protein [Nonomuraea rhodomycinica]|uniref:DUF305 domain-containing protein n=1 Tax=Nonomuraea rhodomycinica TaxID=1712872 RepID=A0A7Y6IKL1_9ACTN|nr:DUF305 domain-containing protein [Nonomuraea rhodomycinica]NUW39475.1 DUF305 domain-containing protein [Nonomuraea rhodomycinica]
MRLRAGPRAAAAAILIAAALTGVDAAAADDQARPAPAPSPSGWRQTCPPGGSWMGPGGPMHGVRVDDEFGYLAQMVPHHQEAVIAARQLRRSERPQMRRLGASIVATQSAEIATMRAWLDQWYPGRSPAVGYRPMMRDLSRLSGDALDEAFLRDMIPHHMGAIMMSQQLLMRGRVEHEQVAAFARTVRDDQHAEMVQMRRWLAGWFGETGMPGMPGMPGGPWPTGDGRGSPCGW